LTPGQLEITDDEKAVIHHLSPLFRTPRAVKRFVNTYRLLRVSLSDSELETFVGEPGNPGEYRVALVLLAVVAGRPNMAALFLRRLQRLKDSTYAADTWLNFLRDRLLSSNQLTTTKERDLRGLRDQLEVIEDEWSVARNEPLIPHRIDSVGPWATQIARYSFSPSPATEKRPSEA
jgi:hypothetical protein